MNQPTWFIYHYFNWYEWVDLKLSRVDAVHEFGEEAVQRAEAGEIVQTVLGDSFRLDRGERSWLG
jgi:hypothetical protein